MPSETCAVESHADEIARLRERLGEMGRYLSIDAKRARQAGLEADSAKPGFWDDPQAAQAVMAEVARLKDDVTSYEGALALLDEAASADELAVEEGDEETERYAASVIAELHRALDDLELSSWFTGEFDHGDAIVTIKPGQGGLESQDWCQMLLHMYLRYCEQRRWKAEVNDAPVAEVIGLDRATFTVSGKNAYGMLRSEA